MRLHDRKDSHSGETLTEGRSGAGLALRVLGKAGMRHACVALAVGYGSVDRRIRPPGGGGGTDSPAGVAHFLEHKMFEKPRGDLFQEFARGGAHANAFTSYARTAYFFTASGDLRRNLDLLLELVFDAHFTEDLVRKEQGIIAQEIRGYDDQPAWRGRRAALEALFTKHPVREDIAGTVESIAGITAGVLSRCHDAWYVPRNMVLCAAGNVDPSEIAGAVEEKLGARPDPRRPPGRNLPKEPAAVAPREVRIAMPVSMPRLWLAFKGPVGIRRPPADAELAVAAEIWLDALLGEAGEAYDRLFARGLITDDFSWSVAIEAGAVWAMIGGPTPDPEALRTEVADVLRKASASGIPEPDVARIRRRLLGDHLRGFDAAESCCFRLVDAHFRRLDPFAFPEILERLAAPAIRRRMRDFIDPGRMVSVILSPGGA